MITSIVLDMKLQTAFFMGVYASHFQSRTISARWRFASSRDGVRIARPEVEQQAIPKLLEWVQD